MGTVSCWINAHLYLQIPHRPTEIYYLHQNNLLTKDISDLLSDMKCERNTESKNSMLKVNESIITK